jgi:hypothetical protein
VKVSGQLLEPAALPIGGKPWYPLDMRQGGPQDQSGLCAEQIILAPTGNSNSNPSVIQPVTGCYTDCNIPAPNIYVSQTNPVALVREQTIPITWSPLVGKLSANFLQIEGVAWSAQWIPTAVFWVFSTGATTFSSNYLNCTHKAEWRSYRNSPSLIVSQHQSLPSLHKHKLCLLWAVVLCS